MNEQVDIVDENDCVIGRADRKECHGDPSLIHRVVHIMVFNAKGEVLLQKRGKNKTVQPGKWDTSVGGHLAAGEGYEEGAFRELAEELGIREQRLEWMYDYLWRSEIETERVRTWRLVYDGPYKIQKGEIEKARFWPSSEVSGHLGKGIFTPNFKEEWQRCQAWIKDEGSQGSR